MKHILVGPGILRACNKNFFKCTFPCKQKLLYNSTCPSVRHYFYFIYHRGHMYLSIFVCFAVLFFTIKRLPTSDVVIFVLTTKLEAAYSLKFKYPYTKVTGCLLVCLCVCLCVCMFVPKDLANH